MAGVKDRVALVTGAGSEGGIGFSCARLLRDAGARVAITSTTERIHKRRNELGNDNNTFAMATDLTNSSKVQELIEATEAALGPIHIVVNNAGMVQVGRNEPSTPMHKITDEGWRYGMDINLTTAFNVTRAVLPNMITGNYGRIVHMSSVTGPVVGIPGSVIYASAKAGMLGMARGLTNEVGSKNITVNCIGPGWIQTESSSTEEIVAGGYTPTGRPGLPDEVGHVAVFLASEEASYINGQLIVVDGGNTIQEYKVALELES